MCQLICWWDEGKGSCCLLLIINTYSDSSSVIFCPLLIYQVNSSYVLQETNLQGSLFYFLIMEMTLNISLEGSS